MMFDELFHVFRLTEQCRKQTPPEGRRIFFDAVFINELDIRLFGYSISERARAPILCEKRTVQYKSIADGLSRCLLWVCDILVGLGIDFEHHKCLADDTIAHAKRCELCEAGNFENCAQSA